MTSDDPDSLLLTGLLWKVDVAAHAHPAASNQACGLATLAPLWLRHACGSPHAGGVGGGPTQRPQCVHHCEEAQGTDEATQKRRKMTWIAMRLRRSRSRSAMRWYRGARPQAIKPATTASRMRAASRGSSRTCSPRCPPLM